MYSEFPFKFIIQGVKMQAIIMAAGRGSRLEHLTNDIPKSFLTVNEIKLIEYNIALLRYFNVKKIIIVTGYKSEYFEDLFTNCNDIQLVYNPFYEMMNVVGSFFMGQEHLSENEDTIYMHADTLCAPEILNDIIDKNSDMVLPVHFKVCDEEAMKVRTLNSHVIEISKSIPCEQAEGEFIGIAKLSKNIIKPLKESVKYILKQKNFNYYFESAIQDMIDKHIYSIITTSTGNYFWGEVDFIDDYNYIIDNLPNNLLDIAKKYK